MPCAIILFYKYIFNIMSCPTNSNPASFQHKVSAVCNVLQQHGLYAKYYPKDNNVMVYGTLTRENEQSTKVSYSSAGVSSVKISNIQSLQHTIGMLYQLQNEASQQPDNQVSFSIALTDQQNLLGS